jgi:hypothetical protein
MENLQTQTTKTTRPISRTLRGNILGAADSKSNLSITYNKRRSMAFKRGITVHVPERHALEMQEPFMRRAS